MIPAFILVIEDLDDREFMSQLFLDFHRLMCHEARKIAKNDWIAEDIVQDTLLKLIDKASLLRTLPRRKLVNYIISATKNTTYNYLRKKAHEDLLSFDELGNTELDLSESYKWNIETIVILHDDLGRLSHIWEKIDKRSQYLLEGKYILGKSSAEMAIDLGIQPDSVRMALTRAKQTAYKFITEE